MTPLMGTTATKSAMHHIPHESKKRVQWTELAQEHIFHQEESIEKKRKLARHIKTYIQRPEEVEFVAKYLTDGSEQLNFAEATDLQLMRDYNALLEKNLILFRVKGEPFCDRMNLFLDQFQQEIEMRGLEEDASS